MNIVIYCIIVLIFLAIVAVTVRGYTALPESLYSLPIHKLKKLKYTLVFLHSANEYMVEIKLPFGRTYYLDGYSEESADSFQMKKYRIIDIKSSNKQNRYVYNVLVSEKPHTYDSKTTALDIFNVVEAGIHNIIVKKSAALIEKKKQKDKFKHRKKIDSSKYREK